MVMAISIVVAGTAFFGGVKYRDYQLQKQRTNFSGGQFFRQGQFAGQNSNGQRQGGQRFGGGALTGQVMGLDDKSMTVKLPDGSTKIVIFSDKTIYYKSSEASKSDLTQGINVAVLGTANSDGSVTAENISINPMLRFSQSPTPTK